MKTFGRITAVASCVLMVAGCGGGGSTPSTTRAASSTATTAPHSGTPLATETLTIKYPATFHQAQLKSTAAKESRNAAGSRRSPAYINASPQPYSGSVEIYVDGTQVVSTAPNPYGQNGSQSFNLPIYATGSSEHYIVAVETEEGLENGSTILAIGETDVSTSNLTPGTTQALSLTMQQNTAYVGLMTDPNDGNNDATAYYGSPASDYDNSFFGSAYDCSTGSTVLLYPFSADPTGGFAAPLGDSNGGNTSFGVGGVADPVLSSWTAASSTSGDVVTAITGGYEVTFNAADVPADSGVLLNFSVASPALAIYGDVENYDIYDNIPGQGTYPGIENLYANGTINMSSLQSLAQSSPDIVQIQVKPHCDGG